MRRRSWTANQLIDAVKDSTSIRQVLKKLGLKEAGGNYHQVKKYISEYAINNSHFTGMGWNVGLKFKPNKAIPIEKLLIENSTYQSYKLKKRLLKEGIKKPKCEICGWAKKDVNGRLPLELDHINGIHFDNRLSNLRILCPNCHSLQATHRGLNKVK